MESMQNVVFSLFSQDQESLTVYPREAISSIKTNGFPSGIGVLPKGHQFSIFKEKHAEEAAMVVNHLLSCDLRRFREDATRLRKILNEGIYLYAVSSAVLHHKDRGGALLPPIWQVNPRSFFPGLAIKRAFDLGKTNRRKVDASDGAAPAFVTGTHRDPEFKVAWWREDCALNGHHVHWHLVYPHRGINKKTKDREGELFYYMHQQMLARYDAERLGVGLPRVEPYNNFHLPIPEGYNAHLTDSYGTQYAPRPARMTLADNWRDPSEPVLISDQEYHYNRLLDAVNNGKFEMPDGSKAQVDIVSLGAAVESSISTPNKKLYGSLHNLMHDLLAAITDPDYRFNQAGGVMCDSTTSIRDPMFFRWHKFIDDLFERHKVTLPPYTKKELQLEGVTVDSVQILVTDASTNQDSRSNALMTCMEEVKVDIANDMFLDSEKTNPPHTPVPVTVHQINHDEFDYVIGINNTIKGLKNAAVRIFMAPSFDPTGDQLPLAVQRRLFIEMDKFVVKLENGANFITRSSTLSSVIRPRELTISELKKMGNSDTDCCGASDRYCECGWPQHMLLPRGTAAGMQFDLFVMVTDWASDSSTDDLDRGTSYCGVKDKKYPDKRAMGFPFDRTIDSPNIAEYARGFSNMVSIRITIKWMSGITWRISCWMEGFMANISMSDKRVDTPTS